MNAGEVCNGYNRKVKENIERGMEKGIIKGMLAMVAALKDFNISDDIILQKIQEKFMANILSL